MKTKWKEVLAGRIENIDQALNKLKMPATQHLASIYAKLLVEAGGIPSKALFRPEDMNKYLAQITLYEVPKVGSPIYKLVGQQAREAFASNPLGRKYTDLVPKERAESASASFRRCCFTPCAMLVYVDHVRRSGKADRHEVIGVPFHSDNEDHGFLLFMDAVTETKLISPGTIDDTFTHIVLSRNFIDLGYGTPEDHFDLIPDDTEISSQ